MVGGVVDVGKGMVVVVNVGWIIIIEWRMMVGVAICCPFGDIVIGIIVVKDGVFIVGM